MRIVFMGTPDFAIPSLEKLHQSRHEVIGVVTVPDKPKGRGQRIFPSAVKKFAGERKLKVLTPANLKDQDFIQNLGTLKPDLILVVAFRILPEEVFTIPPLGTINLHASLLPKYRGAAPINWVIINGETKTGLTTFYIKKKVDTGDIILQREMDIGPEESFGELHDRMARLGAEVLWETVELIERGEVKVFRQDDSQATAAPKITPEHCLIDWSKTAGQLKNQIRGLAPSPGAFTFFRGKSLKLLKVDVVGGDLFQQDFGRTVKPEQKEQVWVITGKGILSLLEVQPEGKKRISIQEFVRGYHPEIGERLG